MRQLSEGEELNSGCWATARGSCETLRALSVNFMAVLCQCRPDVQSQRSTIDKKGAITTKRMNISRNKKRIAGI